MYCIELRTKKLNGYAYLAIYKSSCVIRQTSKKLCAITLIKVSKIYESHLIALIKTVVGLDFKKEILSNDTFDLNLLSNQTPEICK